MARDASQALGAAQLAGAVVMPKGHAWQHLRVHAGLAGAVAAEVIAAGARKHAQAHPAQTPAFPRSAFLAVTDREVALLRLGSGGVMNGRPGEVLARVPRSEVTLARVSAGLARTDLTISFKDGSTWEFEVSPLIRRTVVRVAHALGF
jgi:hypothetical protein